MNWEDWIEVNRKQIEHIVGYEENFVRSILAKIPEINPEDVTAQFHFRDSNGGNRYIDFMIVNESKGYRLPIELDGYWKVTSYHDFNDMLERQNDLVQIYGVLLRYTNNKMNKQPEQVVGEIRKTLELQSKNQLSQKMLEKQEQQRIDEYQQELNHLKDELTQQQATHKQSSSTITKSEIASIQTAIADLQSKIEQNNAPKEVEVVRREPSIVETSKEPIKTRVTANQMLIAGSAGLIIVALGANAFFNKNENTNLETTDSSSLSLSSNINEEDESEVINTEFMETTPSIQNTVSAETDSTVEESRNRQTNTVAVEERYPEKTYENTAQAPAAIKKERENVEVYQPAFDEAPSNNYEAAVSNTVPAAQAYQYIGDYRVVCGHVSQVTEFSKGKYLNLGATYPNQDVTIVVWDSDMGNFDNLGQYEGRELCVQGTVSSYKGTPQVKLSSMNQVK